MVKTTFYTTIMMSFMVQIQSILAAPAAPAAEITVVSTCTTPSTVALTFDDGPFTYTPQLLTTLAKENVTATFFINGNNYGCIYDEVNVASVNDARKAGHQIASHTWSHPDLAKIPIAKVTTEMTQLDDALKKVAGIQPKYMRPPFGSGADNAAVKKAIADTGYTKMVLWDIDPSDAIDPAPKYETQLKAYTDATGPPASHISLNHDIIKQTVEKLVTDELKILREKGYTNFVTVGKCLGEDTEDLWYKFVGAPTVRDATWTCA
jgi:peptidoglycan/xylan/chitin deacetylase (PgdA/CDA1 family)